MAFTRWLCTSSPKNMLLKIVHPGGQVELHDRPVVAVEILRQNPKCCVAYPHVFQQPWAIVAPDTTLMLGQKFYVIPRSTIRKLQRHSLRYSPSPTRALSPSEQVSIGFQNHTKEEKSMFSPCRWTLNEGSSRPPPYSCLRESCLNEGSSRPPPYSCLRESCHEGHQPNSTGSDTRRKIMEKNGCFFDHNCFMHLASRVKLKFNGDESRTESSETRRLTSNGAEDFAIKGLRNSLRRYTSLRHWKPNLQSISEE